MRDIPNPKNEATANVFARKGPLLISAAIVQGKLLHETVRGDEWRGEVSKQSDGELSKGWDQRSFESENMYSNPSVVYSLSHSFLFDIVSLERPD